MNAFKNPVKRFEKTPDEFERAWPTYRNVLPEDRFFEDLPRADRMSILRARNMSIYYDVDGGNETCYTLKKRPHFQYLIYLIFAEFFHLSPVFRAPRFGSDVYLSKEVSLLEVPESSRLETRVDFALFGAIARDKDHVIRNGTNCRLSQNKFPNSYLMYDFELAELWGDASARSFLKRPLFNWDPDEPENASLEAISLALEKAEAILARYEGEDGFQLFQEMVKKAYEGRLHYDYERWHHFLLANCSRVIDVCREAIECIESRAVLSEVNRGIRDRIAGLLSRLAS